MIYHCILENEYGTIPVQTLTYHLPPDTTDIDIRTRSFEVSLEKSDRLLPKIVYTNSVIRQECLFEFSNMYMMKYVGCDIFMGFRNIYRLNLKSIPIELDIFNFATRLKRGKWAPEDDAHCKKACNQQDALFWEIKMCPPNIRLHLVITAIWRDFRTLRAQAEYSGLKDKVKGIRFALIRPPGREQGVWPLPDEAFFKRQTVACLMGYEERLRDKKKVDALLGYGCIGVDWRAPKQKRDGSPPKPARPSLWQ